jgi:hypothetical protein
MNEEMKLKSCPFCGGEGVPKGSGIIGWTIACRDCGARVKVALVDLPVTTSDGIDESTRYTREDAMRIARERWNSRNEAEVKHGYWINTPPYSTMNSGWYKAQECSVCRAYFVSDGHTPYSNHPYCCECGAKMDAKEGCVENG